jgi:hypothetical protein
MGLVWRCTGIRNDSIKMYLDTQRQCGLNLFRLGPALSFCENGD